MFRDQTEFNEFSLISEHLSAHNAKMFLNTLGPLKRDQMC